MSSRADRQARHSQNAWTRHVERVVSIRDEPSGIWAIAGASLWLLCPPLFTLLHSYIMNYSYLNTLRECAWLWQVAHNVRYIHWIIINRHQQASCPFLPNTGKKLIELSCKISQYRLHCVRVRFNLTFHRTHITTFRQSVIVYFLSA